MTVHEVVGRVELSGRQILMLEEDRDRLKQVLAAQDEILNQKIVREKLGFFLLFFLVLNAVGCFSLPCPIFAPFLCESLCAKRKLKLCAVPDCCVY